MDTYDAFDANTVAMHGGVQWAKYIGQELRPGQIYNQIAGYRDVSAFVEAIVDRLASMQKSLEPTWEGSAGEAALAKFKGATAYAQETLDTVQTVVGALRTAFSSASDAQTNLQSIPDEVYQPWLRSSTQGLSQAAQHLNFLSDGYSIAAAKLAAVAGGRSDGTDGTDGTAVPGGPQSGPRSGPQSGPWSSPQSQLQGMTGTGTPPTQASPTSSATAWAATRPAPRPGPMPAASAGITGGPTGPFTGVPAMGGPVPGGSASARNGNRPQSHHTPTDQPWTAPAIGGDERLIPLTRSDDPDSGQSPRHVPSAYDIATDRFGDPARRNGPPPR